MLLIRGSGDEELVFDVNEVLGVAYGVNVGVGYRVLDVVAGGPLAGTASVSGRAPFSCRIRGCSPSR